MISRPPFACMHALCSSCQDYGLPLSINEQRVSKDLPYCVHAESLFIRDQEKHLSCRSSRPPCDCVLKQASSSAYKFRLLKSCNTLSSVIIFDFPRRTPAGILSAAIPRTDMDSDLNLGSQYSELAISALNLNAESQAQDKSFLSYYRLFYLGKQSPNSTARPAKVAWVT